MRVFWLLTIFSPALIASTTIKLATFPEETEISSDPEATKANKNLIVMAGQAESQWHLWVIDSKTKKKQRLPFPKGKWKDPIVAISPSNKYIAVAFSNARYSDEGYLYQYTQVSQKWATKQIYCKDRAYKLFETPIRSMTFAKNSEGKEILITDGQCARRQTYYGPLKVFDASTGSFNSLLGSRQYSGTLSAIAISSNQQYVLASWSGDRDPILFWSVDTKKQVASLPLESIRTIHLEKEKQLIIGKLSGEIHIIRLRTNKPKSNFRKPIKVIPNLQLGSIADMKISKDSRYLAVVYQTRFTDYRVDKNSPGGAVVWDLQKRKPAWKLDKQEEEQVLEAQFISIKTKTGTRELPIFYGYNDDKGTALKWEVKSLTKK